MFMFFVHQNGQVDVLGNMCVVVCMGVCGCVLQYNHASSLGGGRP